MTTNLFNDSRSNELMTIGHVNVFDNENVDIPLKIILPVVLVSVLALFSLMGFFIFRNYSLICAKKRYGVRLELASNLYVSNK